MTYLDTNSSDVSERRFMTTLLKHTGIALSIIVPLAAYSSYSDAANHTYQHEVVDGESVVTINASNDGSHTTYNIPAYLTAYNPMP